MTVPVTISVLVCFITYFFYRFGGNVKFQREMIFKKNKLIKKGSRFIYIFSSIKKRAYYRKAIKRHKLRNNSLLFHNHVTISIAILVQYHERALLFAGICIYGLPFACWTPSVQVFYAQDSGSFETLNSIIIHMRWPFSWRKPSFWWFWSQVFVFLRDHSVRSSKTMSKLICFGVYILGWCFINRLYLSKAAKQ